MFIEYWARPISVIRMVLRAGDVSRGKRGRHPHGNCSQRGEKSSPHIITQKCHQACLAVYLREWNVVLCTERLIPSGGHARCCQSIVLLSHLPLLLSKKFSHQANAVNAMKKQRVLRGGDTRPCPAYMMDLSKSCILTLPLFGLVFSRISLYN